jgi:uncharacterized protein (DUF1697 family)
LGVDGQPAVSGAPEFQSRYVAFVRNIMVGRYGLTAEVLRQIVVDAGGRQPRSHLATGNLAFTASPECLVEFRQLVEASIASVLGRREEVFIRSVAALVSAVESDPFGGMVSGGVHERCVSFLPPGSVVGLSLPVRTPRGDAVLFAVRGDEVFSVTRLVAGRPGQPGTYLEAALGLRVTTRNWNTVERIARMEA